MTMMCTKAYQKNMGDNFLKMLATNQKKRREEKTLKCLTFPCGSEEKSPVKKSREKPEL